MFGDKYDSVMIDQKDLTPWPIWRRCPARSNTLIGDSNVDGTAWMYAVADLHPLWTHYDYPQQTGPGYFRYIFWAGASNGEPIRGWSRRCKALNIRYILTSDADGSRIRRARRTKCHWRNRSRGR